MANLTKTSWPLGWTPSQNNNGNSDGLLRADNLRQDKNGALILTQGRRKLNSSAFEDYVDNIFSKTISNQEYLWASLNKETKSVLRSGNDFASSTQIIGITGKKTVFGEALGQVLVISGTQRKKDDTITVLDLGLPDPENPPITTGVSPNTNELWENNGGTFSLEEGENLIPATDPPFENISAQFWPDPDTLRAIVNFNYPSTYDTTIEGEGINPDWLVPNTNKYNPGEDIFRLVVQVEDSYAFGVFRVEFILNDNNYYSYEWDMTSSLFNIGQDVHTVLNVKRKEFTRHGTDNTLDWATVETIRYSFNAVSYKWCLVGEPSFIGGEGYNVTGEFTYAYHYVSDNGKYIAKSKLSPDSEPTGDFDSGKIQIFIPDIGVEPQVTAAWLYRRSVNSSGLAFYYRVAIADRVANGFFVVQDGLSNDNVLLVNIKANPYLESVQNVEEDIVGMVGLYNERILYLTDDKLYLSDRLNPDAIDSRFTIKAFGDPTEKNLWLKAVSNNQLILATTKDLYEISGSLLDLPDGTLDIFIRGIGEKYPPLSDDVAGTDGVLFYVAADGIRTTGGSNSINVSPQLRLLFQREACHDISPIAIEANNVNNYPMAVSQGKIYISLPLLDGSRRLFIYDTILKVYRYQSTAPVALYSSYSGRLLGGYGPSDNFLRELEYGTQVDGSGTGINLLTVFDHNGQPRNRKDTFTLKLNINTGGSTVRVYLAKDGGSFVQIDTISTSSQSTEYINVNAYTLGFRYAIQLIGDNLETFELYEVTLEYEPRPEQVNFLRLPNTNLGTMARKRITSFAFVVDTLGNDVTFTPYIDNVAQAPSTINKATKLTHIHFFTSETIGTDLGGELVSSLDNPFEFYDLNLEEIVSEKLPTPVKYLVIPSNDYGSPNRKRHTSYKYQINTRGADVRFTPRIDGTSFSPSTVNTSEKRTVEHFFDTSVDIVGIDIGGILETLANTEFEFYGVIVPQDVELLPARLKSFYIPYNNFGVPTKKRIRTIPIIIDTRGSDVTFTPIVDGITLSPTSLNSSRKTTLFHYFETDVFGTDFGGTLIGTNPFEFYSFGSLENVEVLPVGKKYDQFQPLRFDKIGKLFELRVRLIATGSTSSIPFGIFGDEDTTHPNYNSVEPMYSGNLIVTPEVDNTYTIQLPKNVNSSIFRVVLGPTSNPFHRYDMLARVAISGMESDSKWVPLR